MPTKAKITEAARRTIQIVSVLNDPSPSNLDAMLCARVALEAMEAKIEGILCENDPDLGGPVVLDLEVARADEKDGVCSTGHVELIRRPTGEGE